MISSRYETHAIARARSRWAVALAALLLLLFHTFFQAAFSFGALLGAERAWAAWRGRTGWRDLVQMSQLIGEGRCAVDHVPPARSIDQTQAGRPQPTTGVLPGRCAA